MLDRERLFGTDGIRGRVSRWPLTASFVLVVGRAIAQSAREAGVPRLVVIGRDTRPSGPMVEWALGAGLLEGGIDVLSLGIVPTPAVAFLARRLGAGMGVMLSASHNPASDNGIKLLSHTGFKLSVETEQKIERHIWEIAGGEIEPPPCHGQALTTSENPAEAYEKALLSRAGRPNVLRNWQLVLDCAYGATCRVAPRLFRRLGAEVSSLHADPDGEKINFQSGTEHPQALRERVLQRRADAGIAFDGDGDRVLLVDERGGLLDGDDILYILARDLHQQRRLRHDTVVGTVMTNLGLERALNRLGIRLERVPVGDRHVTHRMLDGDYVLGGESSGHVVLFGEGATTGDGLYTAMKVLGVAVRRQRVLSALVEGLNKFPQVMINVPVAEKPSLASLPAVEAAQRRVSEVLGEEGRFLLRYSGTQPLARVMVECADREQGRRAAEILADAIRQEVPGPEGGE